LHAACYFLSAITSLCMVCDQQSLFAKYFQFYVCSFLLLGRLVEDHASASYAWELWVLTMIEVTSEGGVGDQRRQSGCWRRYAAWQKCGRVSVPASCIIPFIICRTESQHTKSSHHFCARFLHLCAIRGSWFSFQTFFSPFQTLCLLQRNKFYFLLLLF
jgi:hypothetical protein